MSNCSISGLLSQPFTSGGTESYYSCAFSSNFTLASKCCSPDTVHSFTDPCYSWCDLPASLNGEFDSGDLDYYQYFQSCLNSTGENINMLWCHAQPHVIVPTTTLSSTTPSSTFNSSQFCETSDPQSLIAVNDPAPACGILPNSKNSQALEACCQPAPVKYSVVHCYEYCGLPRGTAFRGVGNLTYDQTLGSFKTCLQHYGNKTADVFDGIFCRVNGSEIDLKETTFGTTEYLTGDGRRVGVGTGMAVVMGFGLVLFML